MTLRTGKKNLGSGTPALSLRSFGRAPTDGEKWIRTTVLIREHLHGKIKSISFWENKGIKEVVDEALKQYLKGKKTKPLPKKKRPIPHPC